MAARNGGDSAGQAAPAGIYKVMALPTASRVATCYAKHSARLVGYAINSGGGLRSRSVVPAAISPLWQPAHKPRQAVRQCLAFAFFTVRAAPAVAVQPTHCAVPALPDSPEFMGRRQFSAHRTSCGHLCRYRAKRCPVGRTTACCLTFSFSAKLAPRNRAQGHVVQPGSL